MFSTLFTANMLIWTTSRTLSIYLPGFGIHRHYKEAMYIGLINGSIHSGVRKYIFNDPIKIHFPLGACACMPFFFIKEPSIKANICLCTITSAVLALIECLINHHINNNKLNDDETFFALLKDRLSRDQL